MDLNIPIPGELPSSLLEIPMPSPPKNENIPKLDTSALLDIPVPQKETSTLLNTIQIVNALESEAESLPKFERSMSESSMDNFSMNDDRSSGSNTPTFQELKEDSMGAGGKPKPLRVSVLSSEAAKRRLRAFSIQKKQNITPGSKPATSTSSPVFIGKKLQDAHKMFSSVRKLDVVNTPVTPKKPPKKEPKREYLPEIIVQEPFREKGDKELEKIALDILTKSKFITDHLDPSRHFPSLVSTSAYSSPSKSFKKENDYNRMCASLIKMKELKRQEVTAVELLKISDMLAVKGIFNMPMPSKAMPPITPQLNKLQSLINQAQQGKRVSLPKIEFCNKTTIPMHNMYMEPRDKERSMRSDHRRHSSRDRRESYRDNRRISKSSYHHRRDSHSDRRRLRRSSKDRQRSKKTEEKHIESIKPAPELEEKVVESIPIKVEKSVKPTNEWSPKDEGMFDTDTAEYGDRPMKEFVFQVKKEEMKPIIFKPISDSLLKIFEDVQEPKLVTEIKLTPMEDPVLNEPLLQPLQRENIFSDVIYSPSYEENCIIDEVVNDKAADNQTNTDFSLSFIPIPETKTLKDSEIYYSPGMASSRESTPVVDAASPKKEASVEKNYRDGDSDPKVRQSIQWEIQAENLWKEVAQTCQPKMHTSDSCYRETVHQPPVSFCENLRHCNCAEERTQSYESLASKTEEITSNMPTGQCFDVEKSISRDWYPTVNYVLTDKSSIELSTNWETDDSTSRELGSTSRQASLGTGTTARLTPLKKVEKSTESFDNFPITDSQIMPSVHVSNIIDISAIPAPLEKPDEIPMPSLDMEYEKFIEAVWPDVVEDIHGDSEATAKNVKKSDKLSTIDESGDSFDYEMLEEKPKKNKNLKSEDKAKNGEDSCEEDGNRSDVLSAKGKKTSSEYWSGESEVDESSLGKSKRSSSRSSWKGDKKRKGHAKVSSRRRRARPTRHSSISSVSLSSTSSLSSSSLSSSSASSTTSSSDSSSTSTEDSTSTSDSSDSSLDRKKKKRSHSKKKKYHKTSKSKKRKKKVAKAKELARRLKLKKRKRKLKKAKEIKRKDSRSRDSLLDTESLTKSEKPKKKSLSKKKASSKKSREKYRKRKPSRDHDTSTSSSSSESDSDSQSSDSSINVRQKRRNSDSSNEHVSEKKRRRTPRELDIVDSTLEDSFMMPSIADIKKEKLSDDDLMVENGQFSPRINRPIHNPIISVNELHSDFVESNLKMVDMNIVVKVEQKVSPVEDLRHFKDVSMAHRESPQVIRNREIVSMEKDVSNSSSQSSFLSYTKSTTLNQPDKDNLSLDNATDLSYGGETTIVESVSVGSKDNMIDGSIDHMRRAEEPASATEEMKRQFDIVESYKMTSNPVPVVDEVVKEAQSISRMPGTSSQGEITWDWRPTALPAAPAPRQRKASRWGAMTTTPVLSNNTSLIEVDLKADNEVHLPSQRCPSPASYSIQEPSQEPSPSQEAFQPNGDHNSQVFKIQTVSNCSSNSEETIEDRAESFGYETFNDCLDLRYDSFRQEEDEDEDEDDNNEDPAPGISLDDRISMVLQYPGLGGEDSQSNGNADEGPPEHLLPPVSTKVPEKGILIVAGIRISRTDPRVTRCKRVCFADGLAPGQDSDCEEDLPTPAKKRKLARAPRPPCGGHTYPCPPTWPDFRPPWDLLPPPPPPPGSPPPNVYQNHCRIPLVNLMDSHEPVITRLPRIPSHMEPAMS